jgi:hypothetical protein
VKDNSVGWIEYVIMYQLKRMNFSKNGFHVLSHYFIEPAGVWLRGKTSGEPIPVYFSPWDEEKGQLPDSCVRGYESGTRTLPLLHTLRLFDTVAQ